MNPSDSVIPRAPRALLGICATLGLIIAAYQDLRPARAEDSTASGSPLPLALVYAGPGVLPGPYDTLAQGSYVAQQAGFRVIEVTEPVDPALLAQAKLWVQPGGPNLEADEFMNANGMANQVREFVRRGGGYVGFCGGAFTAVNNLHLLPGHAYSFEHPEVEKIPVTWLGKPRYIHFEFGPYFALPASHPAVEVVATYENGSVAAARGIYGAGKVFVSGPHPEAGPGWPPEEDPDGSDIPLALAMIRYVTTP